MTVFLFGPGIVGEGDEWWPGEERHQAAFAVLDGDGPSAALVQECVDQKITKLDQLIKGGVLQNKVGIENKDAMLENLLTIAKGGVSTFDASVLKPGDMVVTYIWHKKSNGITGYIFDQHGEPVSLDSLPSFASRNCADVHIVPIRTFLPSYTMDELCRYVRDTCLALNVACSPFFDVCRDGRVHWMITHGKSIYVLRVELEDLLSLCKMEFDVDGGFTIRELYQLTVDGTEADGELMSSGMMSSG